MAEQEGREHLFNTEGSLDIYTETNHASFSHLQFHGGSYSSLVSELAVSGASLDTDTFTIHECVQRTLPLVEHLLNENRMVQGGLRETSQLQAEVEHLVEKQQVLQEKYMTLKAYAHSLQHRNRDDFEVIENLRTQLKEYKRRSSGITENVAEIAGKLEQGKLRAKQLEADLASTRQEAARTAAELTKQRLENQQKDDDYEKTIQEQKVKILQLEKQLAMLKGSKTKVPLDKPDSSGPGDDLAEAESSVRKELKRPQAQGRVRSLSEQQQQPSPPALSPKRHSYGSPKTVQQGIGYYKSRCEELETKLSLQDKQCQRHVHAINHLQMTLNTSKSDLDIEKADNCYKSEQLVQMKANFELICQEHSELQDKYQQHCVQQQSMIPDLLREAREKTDNLTAQLLAAEEETQERDKTITSLQTELQLSYNEREKQEQEIMNYQTMLEHEQTSSV